MEIQPNEFQLLEPERKKHLEETLEDAPTRQPRKRAERVSSVSRSFNLFLNRTPPKTCLDEKEAFSMSPQVSPSPTGPHSSDSAQCLSPRETPQTPTACRSDPGSPFTPRTTQMIFKNRFMNKKTSPKQSRDQQQERNKSLEEHHSIESFPKKKGKNRFRGFGTGSPSYKSIEPSLERKPTHRQQMHLRSISQTLQLHSHFLSRFLLDWIVAESAAEGTTKKNCEKEGNDELKDQNLFECVLRMNGNLRSLFLSCLIEEMLQKKHLSVVMRDRSIAVRVLQDLFRHYDCQNLILPIFKWIRKLTKDDLKILRNVDKVSKEYLKEGKQALRWDRLKESLIEHLGSLMNIEKMNLDLVRLCRQCIEKISAHQERLNLEQVSVENWVVGSIYFLRLLVPQITTSHPLIETFGSEQKRILVVVGRSLMKVTSGSLIGEGCLLNEVLTELFPVFNHFSSQIMPNPLSVLQEISCSSSEPPSSSLSSSSLPSSSLSSSSPSLYSFSSPLIRKKLPLPSKPQLTRSPQNEPQNPFSLSPNFPEIHWSSSRCSTPPSEETLRCLTSFDQASSSMNLSSPSLPALSPIHQLPPQLPSSEGMVSGEGGAPPSPPTTPPSLKVPLSQSSYFSSPVESSASPLFLPNKDPLSPPSTSPPSSPGKRVEFTNCEKKKGDTLTMLPLRQYKDFVKFVRLVQKQVHETKEETEPGIILKLLGTLLGEMKKLLRNQDKLLVYPPCDEDLFPTDDWKVSRGRTSTIG